MACHRQCCCVCVIALVTSFGNVVVGSDDGEVKAHNSCHRVADQDRLEEVFLLQTSLHSSSRAGVAHTGPVVDIQKEAEALLNKATAIETLPSQQARSRPPSPPNPPALETVAAAQPSVQSIPALPALAQNAAPQLDAKPQVPPPSTQDQLRTAVRVEPQPQTILAPQLATVQRESVQPQLQVHTGLENLQALSQPRRQPTSSTGPVLPFERFIMIEPSAGAPADAAPLAMHSVAESLQVVPSMSGNCVDNDAAMAQLAQSSGFPGKNCAELKSFCALPLFKPQFEKHCSKTCGFCSQLAALAASPLPLLPALAASPLAAVDVTCLDNDVAFAVLAQGAGFPENSCAEITAYCSVDQFKADLEKHCPKTCGVCQTAASPIATVATSQLLAAATPQLVPVAPQQSIQQAWQQAIQQDIQRSTQLAAPQQAPAVATSQLLATGATALAIGVAACVDNDAAIAQSAQSVGIAAQGCAELKDYCAVDKFKQEFITHCPKTCGFCQGGSAQQVALQQTMAVPTSHEQAPFYMMDVGTCCCPDADRVLTQSDCLNAMGFLNLALSSPWEGTSNEIPSFCSWSKTGSNDMAWNTQESKASRPDRHPICKKA